MLFRSRDLDDPTTIASVAESVGSHELLDLLHNLTIADSLATGAQIWSEWKARLIETLVLRVHSALAGDDQVQASSLGQRFPRSVPLDTTDISIEIHGTAATVYVASPDRVGLVEAVAGALSLQRLEVRTANLDTVNGQALQEWSVATQFGEAPQPELIQIGRAHV